MFRFRKQKVPRAAGQLAGRRLLVIEDESVIKIVLEATLRSAGAVLMSSFDQKLDGAILDVNLGHGVSVVPIANRLRERNVPFVFFTGQSAAYLAPVRKAFPNATFVSKPAETRHIVAAVADLWQAK